MRRSHRQAAISKNIVLVVLLFVAMTKTSTIVMHDKMAYAHSFGGKTLNIDDYQILFNQPASTLYAGNNSTLLKFSVMKNNMDIYNVYSALVITEKRSGRVVDQIPYKLYEFSDFTFPYNFQNATDYTVTLQTRINGDEKYQTTPLIASFDLTVADPNQLIPFDELMLFYVTPPTVIAAGIAIYLHSRKNRDI